MKSDMETQLLPPSRPKDWRKHAVIIVFAAIFFCILIVTLYARRLETTVTTEESRTSYEPGFRGPVGSTKSMQATDSTNLKMKVLARGNEVDTLTETIQNLTPSQGIVEGIIVSTYRHGLVNIPLDSLEQRRISRNPSYEVAFNWHSRKVYWIEYKVGIKTANLDSSSAEIVIADLSYLRGLAVDQVTGNFYYGVCRDNPIIRVCDSKGKKCATVVSGVNIETYIWDIALLPSEGLMFWSSSDWRGHNYVARANMAGTNSTAIIINENIFSLFAHELEEKLYWTHPGNQTIGVCDLNGSNRHVLLQTKSSSALHPGPMDIAVYGDSLYFTEWDGVYVRSNRKNSTIKIAAVYVYSMALYGRNNVPSRQNPCKNSPCENLCVLNRLSYSCL